VRLRLRSETRFPHCTHALIADTIDVLPLLRRNCELNLGKGKVSKADAKTGKKETLSSEEAGGGRLERITVLCFFGQGTAYMLTGDLVPRAMGGKSFLSCNISCVYHTGKATAGSPSTGLQMCATRAYGHRRRASVSWTG